MMYNRNQGRKPQFFVSRRHAVSVVTAATAMVVTMVGLSAMFPALADPTKQAIFAHKYIASYANTMARASLLMLSAPLFEPLVENHVSAVPGTIQQEAPGGIHQGAKAQRVGGATGQPIRFEYNPLESTRNRIILRVGDRTLITGLLVSQASPMASLVAEGNNGLISLKSGLVDDRGKKVRIPQIARSYIDTEEGYRLLWSDALAGQLFDAFRGIDDKRKPDGLTIVDSRNPVTIETDGGLEVSGGEPRVAFWKRLGGDRGQVLVYVDFQDVIRPHGQDDAEAMEAVQRVFKWAPVMRLAAESDPAEFQAFVHELEGVRIKPVPTPRLLTEL
jgi:hypothetical protein